MRIHTILSTLFFAIILFLFLLTHQRCAQVGYPTGGDRDSIPPKLKSSNPKSYSVNFNKKTITLNFDEFVTLDKADKEITISPYLYERTNYQSKLRSVTIKFNDSLLPNTTYTINFGNAIKDINESNILKDFSFVFSTGNSIDSQFIKGKIIMADDEKIDSTIKIYAYDKITDTSILTTKPKYIVPVNGKGDFTIPNLGNSKYNLFALKDEDFSFTYNQDYEWFGFLNDPLKINGNNIDSVKIFVYKISEKEAKNFATNRNNTRSLVFNGKFSVKDKIGLINDTLSYTLNQKIKKFDSTKINFYYNNLQKTKLPYFTILDTIENKVKFIANYIQDSSFTIFIDKTAFTNEKNETLIKNDTLNFRSAQKTEYGSLILNFTNLDLSKNPVLIWYSNDKKYKQEPLSTKTIKVNLIEPAKYKFKILFDKDKNGVFTPGNYAKKQQPEIIIPLSKEVNIKANWDNETDLEIINNL